MDYWQTLRNALGHQQLIIPAAAGAIIHDNKILLVKNKWSNKWFIPGGHQELNESIQDTVIREIKEELGLILKIDYLVSIYSSPKWILELSNGDILQQLLFFFKMKGDFSINNIVMQKSEIKESWRYSFTSTSCVGKNFTCIWHG